MLPWRGGRASGRAGAQNGFIRYSRPPAAASRAEPQPAVAFFLKRKESKMKKFAAVLLAAALAAPAVAQQTPAALTDGEIRKVDKDAKKITIRHGAIQNLDMPPMTMVFQVKDPAMLEQVKAGDKVKFQAEKIGGALTVTKIEPAK
jgi:Cu/Ag efflux protein CusF